MTDVTTLPNAGSGDLAAGYVYLWVPGTPPTQCKVAISDLVSLGISTAAWKEPVRAASTANVTLASGAENGDTIDGVVLVTGDRILLKNQTAPAENGVYVVNASGSPSRASDAATGADLVGAAVLVEEGTSNADALFVCTTNAPITLGTTGLTWSQLGSLTAAAASDIWAGTSVTKAATAKALADSAAPQTLTDGATINWNMANGYNAKVTLGGNRTLATPTNPKQGLTYSLAVIQDATGSRTMTWPSAFDWGSAGAPTLTTTASKRDRITLFCTDAATPKFDAFLSGKGFS